MSNLSLILKLIAPGFACVGLIHLFMGPHSDVLLGAQLSEQTLMDPVLDSQNRFYGVAFALYGALFYLCSQNIRQHATVLSCVLWFFFAGGVARLVSIYFVGMPSSMVLLLLLVELVLPLALLLWLRQALMSEK